uniref:Putative Acyl-CoA N-acyltransferase n=1 Tax=mine drainage metagenome TaxID=410659 RepID=E6PV26_9ZZZZ
MLIEVVTSIELFDALQVPWRELESRCQTSSLFVTWQWQRLWWKHYGKGRSLRILVARDGDRLLGVLPMYLERYFARRLLPVAKLCLLGSGGDTAPDDLDPLLLPDAAATVAQEFAEYILEQLDGWDLLHCPDLHADAPFTRALVKAGQSGKVLMRVSQPREIIFGSLPESWEAYLTALSAHRRKALRYKRRQFEQQGGAEVVSCDKAEDLDAGLDRLAALHRLRWAGRTDKHAFSSTQYMGFHRELMHALLRVRALRLMELRLQGKTVAMRYGYRMQNTYFDLQSGFDPAFSALSPGELSVSFAIEHAIREGCSVFDMLKGDYGHKRQFFSQTRSTVEVRLIQAWHLVWAYRLRDWLTRFKTPTSAKTAQLQHAEPSAGLPSDPVWSNARGKIHDFHAS